MHQDPGKLHARRRLGGSSEGLSGRSCRRRERRGGDRRGSLPRPAGPSSLRLSRGGAGASGAPGRARGGVVGRRAAGDLGQGPDRPREQAPRRALGRRHRRRRAPSLARSAATASSSPQEAGSTSSRRHAQPTRPRRRSRPAGRNKRRPPLRWPRHWSGSRSCPVTTERGSRRSAARFADVRVRALSVLAETSLSSGDAREAVKWSAEIVALEPFRETGYRQLMQAHVAAGNRAEALRVYERCRRLLADELGTYPSPETEAIYRGLLEQAPPDVVDVPTSGEARQPDLAAAGATPRRKTGLASSRRSPSPRLLSPASSPRRAAGRTRRSRRTRSSPWTRPVRSQTPSRSERDRSRSLQARGLCGSPTSTTRA